MNRFLLPDFPFRPKSFPFFYGWIILAASTTGIIMSVPGQTIGVSVFIDDLIETLGLSRVQLSAAYMLGTITSSLFLPWSGRLFDRHGARIISVICAALLAMILLYMSQCDRIAAFLSGSDVPAFWVAFITVYAGFSLLRFSGQGMLAMTSRAMLGKWFECKRGFVSGISGVFTTFFFSIAPLGMNWLVNGFDWREAWMAMAALTLAMMVLFWLTFRDNPEECGLEMDGLPSHGPGSDAEPQAHQPHVTHEFTYSEAIRSYSFWIFNLGLSALALIITAITFHIVSIGEQAGLDRDESFFIFLPIAISSIIVNFIFSWVSDRVDLKYTLAAMLIGMAGGLFGVLFLDSAWGQWMVIIGFGISQGIFSPLLTLVWPTFFGRKHLGQISSFNLSCQVFASAVGPFIFGLSFDWFGGYTWGIYACLTIPLALLAFSFFAVNPQTPQYQTAPERSPVSASSHFKGLTRCKKTRRK